MNATALDHDCVYVVCSQCYKIPERVRGRDKMHEASSDEDDCKHRNCDLSQFSSVKHLKDIAGRPNVPSKCVICRKLIIIH